MADKTASVVRLVEPVATTQVAGDYITDNATERIPGLCYNFDNSAASIATQLIMAFVIIALNLTVVSVIVGGPKKTYRKPAFVFIAALATSDIMLALALVCICAVLIGNYQLMASTWVILTASTSVCFNASVNFLLAIAADRLCFIGYNRKYSKIMTRRNVWILIALCWFVAFLPVLPLLFNQIGSCASLCDCYEGEKLTCSHPSCSTVVVGLKKDFLFGLFFYFLVMLISIGSIYLILFCKVRHHANRIRNMSGSSSSRARSNSMKRETRLARTLGIVVAVFFFCWTPLLILYVIDFGTSDSFKLPESVIFAIMSPAIFNSMCNPIIYAARIPRMRRYLCPCVRKEDDTSTEGSYNRKSRTGGVVGKNSIGKGGAGSIRIKGNQIVGGENGKQYGRGSFIGKTQASTSKEYTSTGSNEPVVVQRSGRVSKASIWIGEAIRFVSRKSSHQVESPVKKVEVRQSSTNSARRGNNSASLSLHIDGIEILDESVFDDKL
uniref:Adenosine receptor A3-like n=1 Tax=Phallusia mammillata TaxID=59560 RepID=A0A6F9D5D9_9ASCI|nr:adenosine receptor A3-like [Phallusia mammillata]